MSVPLRDHLAVCSWSLQPNSPAELIAKLKLVGIPRSRRPGIQERHQAKAQLAGTAVRG